MRKRVSKKSIASLALLLSFSLILSYIESIIPVSLGVPGAKLGLANIVTLLLLYTSSISETLLVSFMRILISGFMFGNTFSIIYSLSGFLLSFITMIVLKKLNIFSSIGVSIAGGVMHNIGQLLCASLIAGRYVLVWFPFLLIAGVIAGIGVGIIAALLLKRVGRFLR